MNVLNLDWLGVVPSCFWKRKKGFNCGWKMPNCKNTEETNHTLNRNLDLFARSIWICCQFRLYLTAKTARCFRCPFDSSTQSFVIHTLLFYCWNKLHTHTQKKLWAEKNSFFVRNKCMFPRHHVPKYDICVAVGSSFIPPWCDVISDLWPLLYTPSILPLFFLLFAPFLPSPRCLGPRQK